MSNCKSIFSLKFHNRWQKFLHSDTRQSTTKKILATFTAIFVAFFIALIIACSVCNTWPKFGEVIKSVFISGFESKTFINSLLSNMAILIVGGLSFIFAYKAGLFNIGISGQMVAGATGATLICHLAGLGHGANQFVILLVSIGIGAFVGALTGALKAFLKINEVVSSIMFNWIIYFMSILILANAPIAHDASELNTLAPADDILFRINGESWIPLLITAIVTVVLITVILNFTVFGKKQKVTGLSNTGALAAGYNVKANMISSMAISGAIAGLLGIMLYCGFSPNMPVTAATKAIPQEGFNGVSVGLISMCNPFASIPVSLFFSMVKTSVSNLQVLGIDNHIGDVIFGIVVYGAAAIALFMNIKPYWLTLNVFKGKNFSKIKHEQNMSNIELISISSDHCAMLHKYFVYYQKQLKIPSSFKFTLSMRIAIWWSNIRYFFVQKRANYRVWRNQEFDMITNNKYYKQEMVHLVKENNLLIADREQKIKRGGWYIKVSDDVLANKKLRTKLQEITKCNVNSGLLAQLQQANEAFKIKPFNNHIIRLTAKLAYLQNLRTGLTQRNTITKRNKLTYFTLQQTKQQAESVGLDEIRSRGQYVFARVAFFKAYQKTFDQIREHYKKAAENCSRNKSINISDIRMKPFELEQLYIENLKNEIKVINHLLSCPLSKTQLSEVSALVSKSRYLETKMTASANQASSYKNMAQPCFEKAKYLNEKLQKYHVQLKNNTKLINKLIDCPPDDLEPNEIKTLIDRSNRLNKSINYAKTVAINAQNTGEDYINRSKDALDSVATDKITQQQINNKIDIIVSKARATEKTNQTDKWETQRIANENAEKYLKKLAYKRAKKIQKGGE